MKQKRWIALALSVLVASPPAWGGEVENQVRTAMNGMAAKANECGAVIRDVLGTPFEEQVNKAMEDLKQDPRSLQLQTNVIDILVAHAGRLRGSLGAAKGSDLGGMRDRVVKGLDALAEAKKSERDRYLARAKESAGPEWRTRYEELAAVCGRLSRSYAMRAEQYRAVPVTQQLVQVQLAMEYLASVKEVLESLRDGINSILSDDEALHELERLTVTVEGVQKSLKTFSEVVLAGAIAGDNQLISSFKETATE